ncbi:hypothetical protein ACOR62_09705 [Neisseria lisongii]|uniref:Integral membrane protein n=1 Tax=Neisseria lisongii TaxID=2912188 RepID=A0AAW5AJ74_9NEIS|nr:hypothetical protein [Neisseria lisongii]MCF7529918.1 hypothetical protein [Neisseria lisongii]
MKRLLTSLPVWLVLADMVYGLGINVYQSLNLHQSAAPDSPSLTPEIAFNSLQIISNGGMVLIIGFGLTVLLQLNRSVLRRQILPIGIFRTLGLIAVLAFSLPAVWEWFWAILNLMSGNNTINLHNPRYLITALCLPLTALLCLARLFGWYRLHRTHPPEAVYGERE